ncbi:hypothetical protein [Bacillus sp. B15-48]|uniref:hypothetical protein n=1 Tax=Bacillus sp. B15-48 TaxID=1548601 RepID=UPI00193F535A|nr:hypothetical protein [Bacillus sp. B15-48]MBM4761050.1 hypothetical protein [Bacillus sp. B15-48]
MKRVEPVSRKSKYQTLKTIYETNLTVDSIAEELLVCEINDSVEEIKRELTARNYDLIGVIEENHVIGYVEKGKLQSGTIRDYVTPIQTRDIIAHSTPLIEFLHIFKDRKRIFVLEKNEVTQLVTAADLQKPPVRILIFGYITLLEMNLGELIHQRIPNNGWQSFISESRVEKAMNLLEERKAKDEDINLVECLQISDKLQIIKKDPFLKEHFQLPSNKEWKRISNDLRDLRDKIAHSNALGIDMTWKEIIELIEKCEQLLEASERLAAPTPRM